MEAGGASEASFQVDVPEAVFGDHVGGGRFCVQSCNPIRKVLLGQQVNALHFWVASKSEKVQPTKPSNPTTQRIPLQNLQSKPKDSLTRQASNQAPTRSRKML